MIIKSNKNNGLEIQILRLSDTNKKIGIVIDDKITNKTMGIAISEENWDKVVKSLSQNKKH